MATQKIDLGVNVGSAPADIGKVGDALGGLGQTVDQVQTDLADLAKTINSFISAKAALAGKTPRLLDLTADKAALEELRASIKDVIAQNPTIKRHVDIANGKNANITSPSQFNLPGIATTAQGQAQFIERFITRLIARNQSAGKNKINTGLTSQELLNDAPRGAEEHAKKQQLDKFDKATGLLGAAGKIASNAVQGGAGGTLGQAASSILGGASDAKAAGAGKLGMLKGGGIAAAAFAAYKVASAVDEGLDRAKEEAIGIDKFKRQLGDVGVGFDDLRDSVRDASVGMGLTYKESLKLTGLYASTSNMGNKDLSSLNAETKIANSFARATGVANEETAKFFGEMRYSGATANPGESKQMALAMADAIKRTGSPINADQMLQSIASYASQIKDATMGNANALGFADALSGVMAANGLKAGAAAGLVNQVDASVRQGGVNDAWQAEWWQALNGEKLGLGRYKILQEGGAFASEKSRLGEGSLGADMFGAMEGATDENNITKEWKRIKARNPGTDQQSKSMMLAEIAKGLTGDSFSKAAAFVKTQERYGEEGLNKTGSLLQRAGVTQTDFNAEGINTLAELANTEKGGVETIRQSMLNRKGLKEKDKIRIENAGRLGDEDAMRLELTRIAASMGQEVTQGKQLTDTAASMDNSLTKLADNLIPISIASRDLLGALVEKANPDSAALKAMRSQQKEEEKIALAQKVNDETLLPADADKLNAEFDEKVKKARSHGDGSRSLLPWEMGRDNEYIVKLERERGAKLGKYARPLPTSEGGMLDQEKAKAIVAQGVNERQSAGQSASTPASASPTAAVSTPSATPAASELKGGSAERAKQLLPEISRVEKDLSLAPGELAGLVQQESAFRPDVYGQGIDKNGNKYQSKAYGLGQMTPSAIKDISSEFREKFGRDYDQSNPTDQLYAAGMYWRRKKNKFGSAEKANQAYFAGDGGLNGSGVVSKDQVEAYGRETAEKQRKMAALMASKEETLATTLAPNDQNKFAQSDPRRLDRASAEPVKVPENNPQAKAESDKRATEVNVNVSGKATLYDKNGQPAADPLFFATAGSGKVSKPQGSAAGRAS